MTVFILGIYLFSGAQVLGEPAVGKHKLKYWSWFSAAVDQATWKILRSHGIEPRERDSAKIPEGQGPRWYHVYVIRGGAEVCRSMIRSCNPEGENHLTPLVNSVQEIVNPLSVAGKLLHLSASNLSFCNSWLLPFLLSSRRLGERVTTFLVHRLRPEEAMKITAALQSWSDPF